MRLLLGARIRAQFRLARDLGDAAALRVVPDVPSAVPPSREAAEDLARRAARWAVAYARNEQARVLAPLGYPVPHREAESVTARFVAEVARDIQGIADRTRARVERVLVEAVRENWTREKLAEELAWSSRVSLARAEGWARNEVGTLNGRLTEYYQQRAGVRRYEWTTAGDDAVRPSHAELDGTEHEWGDPPDVDGEPAIPGEPWFCRCVAVALRDD